MHRPTSNEDINGHAFGQADLAFAGIIRAIQRYVEGARRAAAATTICSCGGATS